MVEGCVPFPRVPLQRLRWLLPFPRSLARANFYWRRRFPRRPPSSSLIETTSSSSDSDPRFILGFVGSAVSSRRRRMSSSSAYCAKEAMIMSTPDLRNDMSGSNEFPWWATAPSPSVTGLCCPSVTLPSRRARQQLRSCSPPRSTHSGMRCH